MPPELARVPAVPLDVPPSVVRPMSVLRRRGEGGASPLRAGRVCPTCVPAHTPVEPVSTTPRACCGGHARRCTPRSQALRRPSRLLRGVFTQIAHKSEGLKSLHHALE